LHNTAQVRLANIVSAQCTMPGIVSRETVVSTWRHETRARSLVRTRHILLQHAQCLCLWLIGQKCKMRCATRYLCDEQVVFVQRIQPSWSILMIDQAFGCELSKHKRLACNQCACRRRITARHHTHIGGVLECLDLHRHVLALIDALGAANAQLTKLPSKQSEPISEHRSSSKVSINLRLHTLFDPQPNMCPSRSIANE
jgi:hypothetical protein